MGGHRLPAVATGAAAAAGVAALALAWLLRRGTAQGGVRSSTSGGAKAKRPDGTAPLKPYHRGMREREYLRLIPEAEMRQLRSLLRRVYAARGWADDVGAREAAWEAVVAAAQEPHNGAWDPSFSPDTVSSQQLQSLLALIERTFLGGLLSDRVRDAKRPPLTIKLGVDRNDPYSWLSGLNDDNIIFVNKNRWRDEISDGNPMNFEGAICRSKLEALAHALGHELVHALVLNFFPAMDARCEAYTADDKHGPVFMLLNKRLFGHVGHASHRLFGAPPG
ncbi:hypothetical protein HYH03_000652 [Edaphochlamys debaryana]|uniref:Uncharacterized protein n=1 Tax=Edaphochlamys debaryana TaxID=47281 RepID=A0A836C6R1_9CHLO|nr:hypothetical protein HYH03_000652 [Edaphochlamys debaryana]|eukprot:KAG2502165.1 hypothetical protein HYH03_000652 [Edaphochlamys debaryana]